MRKDKCKCGNEKDARAKQCRQCRYPAPNLRRRDYAKGNVGPRYGKDVDFSHLDPLWSAQFCGFFLGEGTVIVERRKKGTNYLYRQALIINLRDDDDGVLIDIQHKLGGRVNYYSNQQSSTNSKPQARWYVTGTKRVYAILLLFDGLLPGKKLREVSMMKEYCEWKLSLTSGRLGEEGRAISEDYRLKLQELRKYKIVK